MPFKSVSHNAFIYYYLHNVHVFPGQEQSQRLAQAGIQCDSGLVLPKMAAQSNWLFEPPAHHSWHVSFSSSLA